MDKVSILLKTFVIGAGVMLIAGTLLLAAMIVVRMGQGSADLEPLPAAFGAAGEVELPAGARVEQVVPHDERLVLLLTDAEDVQFILVIDLVSGTRQSLIRLTSGPAAAARRAGAGR